MKRFTATVALLLLLLPMTAFAQTEGVLATKRPVTWSMIFALLFLMLGPIKLLGPFATATKDSDRVFRFRLATRAFLFAVGAVTIAAALGKRMLDNFAIPIQVLQIMIEMGVLVQVPEADIAGGKATPGATIGQPSTGERPSPLNIQSGPTPPADAHVAVPYKGRWFWIADNDVRSKSMFNSIMLLFSIAEVGVRSSPAIVTVPAN